jgi:inosine triphosphate pyrophosphatase
MAELPIFITGNQNKADHLAKSLGITLEHQKVDLDEIQSMSLGEIVTHKVKQAYGLVGKPVLVEDVSLSFSALNGLPGPFIKFFLSVPDGLEKLCSMLDGFDDRRARGECVYAYYDGDHLEIFRGSLDGVVPRSPRGENGFGWDAIFEPDGYGGKTRAELSPDEYAEVYEVIRPFAALRDFLKSNE